MKTFSTLFNTEKNKKTGASPVWILKIPFVAGTVYLSDRLFTYTGITIKPWIYSWGTIDEDIVDEMGSPQVSDFAVDIIIDPDEATDIHDLLWSESVETLKCELYLWFEGLTVATDPMVLMWAGNIIDFYRVNELLYNVRLVDESVRIDKHPGRVLSLDDYASASLDDVGKQMNIIYGDVEKVPALRLDVGTKTSLISAITSAATSFYVSSGTGLSDGMTILIDAEQISITTISGNQITACTRGHGSTTAVAHQSGSAVLEKQATSVFLFADHPVKAIDNIYALRSDGIPVDVTSICTKYTGQGGAHDLAGYEGKAVITCPGYITFAQAVALGTIVDEGSHGHTGDASVLVWNYDKVISTGGTVYNAKRVIDGLFDEYASLVKVGSSVGTITVGNTFYKSGSGTPTRARACIATGGLSGVSMSFAGLGVTVSTSTDDTTARSAWNALGTPYDTWDEINNATGACTRNSTTGGAVYEVWMEIESTSSAAAGAATGVGVTITGNQYASIAVGDNILISGSGYQDDGSGTFTGTASALIEQPDQIFQHFLYTYVAWPTADFETDADTFFAADSYTFGVVINERKRMKEWLAYMALQCRCWFRFSNGKAYLLYRQDALVSDKTITAAMIRMNDDFTTSMKGPGRSPLDEIINKISLYYSRDWTKSGREAYQAIVTVEDATSITAYGEKEKPDLFLFDFITDATMAADVAAFYLARYKDRKKVITMDLFLDNAEIEFADAITVTPLSALVGEVRKVNFSPGSGRDMRNDMITIMMREY